MGKNISAIGDFRRTVTWSSQRSNEAASHWPHTPWCKATSTENTRSLPVSWDHVDKTIHSQISKTIQLPWFIKELISLGHLLTNICYSSTGKQYGCTLWNRYTWSLLSARIKEATGVYGKDIYVQNLPSCFICILFTTPERLITMPIKFCSHWSVTYVLETGMGRKVGYVSKNLH